MIRHTYRLIMDPEDNALRVLPRMVRFQYMLILSYIWSTVFTIWVGSAFLLWPAVLGHTAVLIAIFFTADVFRLVSKDGSPGAAPRVRTHNHRDAMRDWRDGTVLYDDIWGAPSTLTSSKS